MFKWLKAMFHRPYEVPADNSESLFLWGQRIMVYFVDPRHQALPSWRWGYESVGYFGLKNSIMNIHDAGRIICIIASDPYARKKRNHVWLTVLYRDYFDMTFRSGSQVSGMSFKIKVDEFTDFMYLHNFNRLGVDVTTAIRRASFKKDDNHPDNLQWKKIGF
jgi:hypothetical protein